MHFAGAKHGGFSGYAVPVCQEHLSVLIGILSNNKDEIALEISDDVMDMPLEWKVSGQGVFYVKSQHPLVETNFMPLGSIAPISSPVESDIYPSPCSGVIQVPSTKPAMLRKFRVNGIEYNPLEIARSKANVAPCVINREQLKAASFDVKQMIDSKETVRKRVLTVEEGMKGVDGDNLMVPMERNTSPGWRWSAKKKDLGCVQSKGKQPWMGANEEWILDNEDLRKQIDLRLENARKGIRTPTYWTDTLKDERRPIPKVDQGKTRLFSSGEMDYNIVFRMFFLGFMAHMAENRIDFESCVGVNVYSQEWSFVAQRIQSKGKSVVAGDFTNFDGTLHASVLWKICELINEWYDDGEENALVRNVLWSEIVHSVHVSKDMCYAWNHSQPSGNPATVIINCLYNSIAVRMCWLSIVANLSKEHLAVYGSLACFLRLVAMIAYGDDNVINISDEVKEWFNMSTLVSAFAEFGMIYTDEIKSGRIVPYKNLSEIQFLKRAFRFDESQARYRAPLSLDTILEMSNWVRGRKDQHLCANQILLEAAHELAQHEEVVFNKHLPSFLKAAQMLKPQPRMETYKSYQLTEFNRYAW
jgi:hypothetical protein